MKIIHTLGLLILGLLLCPAAPSAREIPVDETVNAELDYLLGLVGDGGRKLAALRSERLDQTLEFLASTKEPGALYYARDRNGAPSAYLQLDLRRPMGDVLRLSYDTDLPAVVTSPSTVRTARWRHTDSGDGRLPRFWERVGDAGQPLAGTGVEHLVNSPDAHTGAYYEYDLDRSLVLTRWRNRPLFISLSAQKGQSAVGKQGIILGADEHWTYLYSGLPGLNWPGFGWVDSYLYDSYSVAFYLGPAAGSAPTRFGIFKWIKAGWLGMNMVQKSHIADGLRRYADAFRLVLESPRTTDVQKLVRQFAAIRDLPRSQLTRLTEAYVDAVRADLGKTPPPSGAQQAAALLAKGGYSKAVGEDDMVSIASLEKLKELVGKPHYVTVSAGPGAD